MSHKSFIAYAAIMFANGEIISGRNYESVRSLARKIGISGDYIYGFLTSSEEFILPHDAARVAMQAGQIRKPVDDLSPDDVWPILQTD
jgi:hypothetical protein